MQSTESSKVSTYTLKNGNSSQLFGVHGAGGMLFFGNLISVLDNQVNFSIMQLDGLDRADTGPPNLNIIDLSNYYADEIEKLLTLGPTFVCGLYGPIVLETGQRLLERGVKVDALIIFDSTAPLLIDRPSLGPIKTVITNPVRKWLAIPDNLGFADWARRKLRTKQIHQPSKNIFSRINGELVKNYTPKRYPGLIWLIRSEQFAAKPSKNKHLVRWSKITNQLEVAHTSGTHHTMWEKPHLANFGETINKIVSDKKK